MNKNLLPNEVSALLRSAAELFESGNESAMRLCETAQRLESPHWTVLMSGLRSVGKSSFGCALWGDSQLLPTAERDCTQVNTLLRKPGKGQSEPQVKLSYLTREQTLDFATRGLAFYRLTTMVAETIGPAAPAFDEMPPEPRIRSVIDSVRKIFNERPRLQVLNENLTDDLEELEQLLAFLDSPIFKSGETIDGDWLKRRDYLMGLRRPDGRTFDVGPLLALKHVELIRESECWDRNSPRIIDTPFVPTFHNARRMDLILAQARSADVLVIVARPEPYALEDWMKQIFKERSELPSQTIVVFNQIDTVDAANLFARDGFAQAYQQNIERFASVGIRGENVLLSCARLPFLLGLPQDKMVRDRTAKLRAVLQRLRKLAEGRAASEFKQKLLRACDESDGGLKVLREKLSALGNGPVHSLRVREALNQLQGLSGLDIAPSKLGEFMKLRERVKSLGVSRDDFSRPRRSENG